MVHNPELPLPVDVIPHRPPSLWLDGVTEVEDDNHNATRGFWTPGDEHFEGHFDGMPLLMAVKQVESLAQLGAYAFMFKSETPVLGLFKEIEHASFVRPVRPGERLDLHMVMADQDKRSFKGVGVADVSGEVACRATIVGTIMSERAAKRYLGAQ